MNSESIAVIIPCYNEALTIGKVIDDFHRELPRRSMYTITTRQTIPRASQRNTAPQCALSPDRERAMSAVRCSAISMPIVT